MPVKQAQAVTVSLEDLKSGNVPLETLEEAFGPNSLGILLVKDVPREYAQLRRTTLSYASYMANLPASELEKLESPKAKYLTGWSRGKENLRAATNHPDTHKGSYYANCAFYADPSLECALPPPGFPPASFPEYLSPNVWPRQDAAAPHSLPGFRAALTTLCRVVIDVAVLVARACDRFAERDMEGYPPGYLERVVGTSTTSKARLLHYFPVDSHGGVGRSSGGTEDSHGGVGRSNGGTEDDDWCATHLDHGCLTGLTSAMYVDERAVGEALAVVRDGKQQQQSPGRSQSGASASLPPLDELPSPPDPSAGLHIVSRTGETYQVSIPRDCIAFQTGEALERITGGRFRAVPHYVRGVRAGGGAVARNTLAVFTQPDLGDVVDLEGGLTFGEFARGVVAGNTMG